MNWFEIKLAVRSPLGTRLAADTLFGHLCWSILYQEGQAALTDFLRAYHDGAPPLVLGDPQPDGFWPLPVLPKPSKSQAEQLERIIQGLSTAELDRRFNSNPTDPADRAAKKQKRQCTIVRRMLENRQAIPTAVDAFDLLKWLADLNWLPTQALSAVIDNVSTAAIWGYFIQNGCGVPKTPQEAITPHNTINRLTGTTGERGSFFFTRRLEIDPADPPTFWLLAGSPTYSADHICQMLTAALAGGYGKYKSRGCGKVEVASCAPAVLPAAKQPNAVMLLANCAPAPADPTDGFWKLTTKAGKLGGLWAVGPHPSGEHMIHKKPLTMLTAGSVLQTSQPKPFYGRLVQNAHPKFQEVCHYAIAPALPIRLAEDNPV